MIANDHAKKGLCETHVRLLQRNIIKIGIPGSITL